MQARHRLRGGRGGGSTLLFMLSLLSVCSIKGAVSRQASIFLFNFANYSTSIAMELKVSKEITCK